MGNNSIAIFLSIFYVPGIVLGADNQKPDPVVPPGDHCLVGGNHGPAASTYIGEAKPRGWGGAGGGFWER